MHIALISIVSFLEIAVIVGGFILFGSLFVSLFLGSPYMGIPKKNIRNILGFGGLSSQDTMYDLGAGDGRIVIAAKKYFSVKKIVGVELSPWPYWKARIMLWWHHVGNSVILKRENILSIDASDATFVYMYLYTSFINEKLAPKLAQELKVGTKILSCSSQIDCARYPMFKLVKKDFIYPIHVYLYRKI